MNCDRGWQSEDLTRCRCPVNIRFNNYVFSKRDYSRSFCEPRSFTKYQQSWFVSTGPGYFFLAGERLSDLNQKIGALVLICTSLVAWLWGKSHNVSWAFSTLTWTISLILQSGVAWILSETASIWTSALQRNKWLPWAGYWTSSVHVFLSIK